MESLYSLTADFETLMEYADSTDPEDEQVFLDTLDNILATIDVKMDNYAAVMTQLEARENLLDAEIKRLTKLKNAVKANEIKMSESLKASMIATGRRKIVTDLHTFSIKKNGGKLPLDIYGDVPDEYTKVTIAPDNDLIRAALDRGEALDFAQYKERGERLSID